MPQITVMSIKVVKKDLSRLNLEPKARTKDATTANSYSD